MRKKWENFKVVRYLFKVAGENHIALAGVMAVLVLLKSLQPFPLIIFPSLIIDRLMSGDNDTYVIFLILAMVVSHVGINLLNQYFLRKHSMHQARLRHILHEQLSDAVMDMEYEKIEDDDFIKKVGRAKVAVNGDLSWAVMRGVTGPRGIEAICMGFANIVVGITQIAGYLYILSVLRWEIVLLIVAAVLMNSWLAARKKRIDFLQRERTSTMGTRMGTCHMTMEDIGMAKDIRMFEMDSFLKERHRENRREYFAVRKGFFLHYLSIEEGALLINGIQNLVVYLYFALMVIRGEITIGLFSRYSSTVSGFVNSLSLVIESVININLFGEYMEDYCDIVTKAEPGGTGKEVPCPKGKHTIVFEHVWFRYPGAKEYALRDIDLRIESGAKILIVGLNGAGKSTLIKLMLRFYRPTEGRILMDGMDIDRLDRQQYLALFSAIFQDYRIYAESVKENIMFGQEDRGRFEKVLQELQIPEILEKNGIGCEDVLSKEFDDRGKELSQGQKQKIVLARVLFKPSEILILDEPTAALDAYAEGELYRDFGRLAEGRTVLYISHRLSAAAVCDDIIVIKDGAVTEQGRHQVLMENRSDYYEMYRRQAGNYR